ncbi:MAG: glycosyltransferase [Cyanobacteria bacterium P01_D01_bin.14]
MILITVGTEKFQFNRLMRWIEQLIQQKILQPDQERIVVQYGASTVLPKQTQTHALLPTNDFKRLMQQARLIIAHCGEGTLNALLESNRPFILVPRSRSFGEHVDNHQIEMAQALATRKIPIAYAPADLARFIAAPHSPLAPLLREYQIFSRWGVHCPENFKESRYTLLTKQKTVGKLCQQLNHRFTPTTAPSQSGKAPVLHSSLRSTLVKVTG